MVKIGHAAEEQNTETPQNQQQVPEKQEFQEHTQNQQQVPEKQEFQEHTQNQQPAQEQHTDTDPYGVQEVQQINIQDDLKRNIHSLNDPEVEAIKVDDGSRYVGVVDATGKHTTVLCPSCGSPAHGATNTCPACGNDMQGDPSWDLVQCTDCSRTFPETRDTCPHCDSTQAQLLDRVECSKCSSIFNPARGNCPACGSEEAYKLP